MSPINEVRNRLKPHRKVFSADKLKNFKDNYKTQLELWGLTVPLQRKLLKQGYRFLSENSKSNLKNWDQVFKESQCMEMKSQAAFYYQGLRKKPEELILAWPTVKKWPTYMDNWAISDVLSDIYSHTLEYYPEKVFPELKRWNKSKNPWYRRQSIVSLLYYANSRNSYLPFDQMIPLVTNLLTDKDYYVQKGVGWTLRELYNVYPKKTLKFLYKNFHMVDSRAFSAAIEKLNKTEKEKLKKLRKNYRQKH